LLCRPLTVKSTCGRGGDGEAACALLPTTPPSARVASPSARAFPVLLVLERGMTLAFHHHAREVGDVHSELLCVCFVWVWPRSGVCVGPPVQCIKSACFRSGRGGEEPSHHCAVGYAMVGAPTVRSFAPNREIICAERRSFIMRQTSQGDG
jgi:hypothetical protein